ncbi:MAG TPA: Holliday junction branch migration protein RuvA [Gemmatimonadales bacterium]|nr:Holliday junction branch migration protein RuvA [Gemmatimonadales bacterium]
MISTILGVLADRSTETVVVETSGGVGYAVTVPLGVHERLPEAGKSVRLFTELVVKEDGWALYGFDDPAERSIFQRLLGASGVGPKLALAILSHLGPAKTVRALQGKDVTTLSTVSGIGKKKAEKMVIELHDRFADVKMQAAPAPLPAGDAAVQALLSLGYSQREAESAVRAELQAGTAEETGALVKRALQRLASR